jgi:asparagine synthase (glutamine-hydrolysing)
VHVYGTTEAEDVKIAKTIARAENLPIEIIDKNAIEFVRPEHFAEQVEKTFRAFDGLPNDGIFDNGADLRTRLDRCRGGALMLNGGGGEVFRNFFYLGRRDYSIRELLWSFYSQFDPAICTDRFSEERYHAALTDAIRGVTGRADDRLPRAVVEYLYPAFRCRFWMGRNNLINNRMGWALTPFVEPQIVRESVRVPLTLKEHGQFEASMIAAIHPRLASYPSAYGHTFSGRVPVKRRLKDSMTLFRPPLLRRFSYQVQRRFSRLGPRPYFLGENYLNAALPGGFTYMSDFFRMDRLSDWSQFNRVCTLEYFCGAMGPSA